VRGEEEGRIQDTQNDLLEAYTEAVAPYNCYRCMPNYSCVGLGAWLGVEP
jgi:hypothetical protein